MEPTRVPMDPAVFAEMEPGVLKYQYDQLIKHLLLLQNHVAARTCPYAPSGELCIRKHLLAVEAYAEETIPMEKDATFKGKLESLEEEARNYRLEQETVLCGEKAQCLEGIEHWARKWRKEFELHALACRTEEPAGPPVPEAFAEKASLPQP